MNRPFRIFANEESLEPSVQVIPIAIVHGFFNETMSALVFLEHVVYGYRVAVVVYIHAEVVEFVVELNPLMLRGSAPLHEEVQEYKRVVEIALVNKEIVNRDGYGTRLDIYKS